ncbi:MAG: DUF5615 family PIN-like protein [Chloroflexi bacterium]|nr:DUF5615 family PIN-like protein [Chloroflexota bacterium]
MNFLADMGISPGVVSALRDLGHGAVHFHALGLDRLPDKDILVLACSEGRVLLTHDLDFGELLAVSGAVLPSVITFRLRNMRPDNVLRHLRLVLDLYVADLEAGAFVTVAEGHVRIRALPL